MLAQHLKVSYSPHMSFNCWLWGHPFWPFSVWFVFTFLKKRAWWCYFHHCLSVGIASWSLSDCVWYLGLCSVPCLLSPAVRAETGSNHNCTWVATVQDTVWICLLRSTPEVCSSYLLDIFHTEVSKPFESEYLKDDAVKVLHSICQQIWKTQQ